MYHKCLFSSKAFTLITKFKIKRKYLKNFLYITYCQLVIIGHRDRQFKQLYHRYFPNIFYIFFEIKRLYGKKIRYNLNFVILRVTKNYFHFIISYINNLKLNNIAVVCKPYGSIINYKKIQLYSKFNQL